MGVFDPHVLEYALRGLGETQRKVLHALAAFRMPATWDTLRTLLVEPPLPLGEGGGEGDQKAEIGLVPQEINFSQLSWSSISG